MHRRIAAAVYACLLAGCAGATGTMLSEDTAVVRATGNSINDQGRVIQETLKEAAQLTREHGFNYFIVLKTVDVSSYGERRVPGQTLANQALHDYSYGSTNLGGPYKAGHTYTTPDRSETYIRPGLEMTVRMFRQGEVNPQTQGVWTADVVLGNPVPAVQ